MKGLSSHFVWLNRSKESLALDVKHAAAKEILARLLARADVFIQNLAPGAAKRLGLAAESLLSRHPRLIICDLSGYGDSGPYAGKKAYDLLVQSEAGVLSVTGTADMPSKVGISIADIATFPWTRNHDAQGVKWEDNPNLARWFNTISERPAVKAALAKVGAIKSNRETATEDQKDRFFNRGRYARA